MHAGGCRCPDRYHPASRFIHAGENGDAIRLSGDFHLRLADIAGNRSLREVLRQLVAQTSLAISRYVPSGSGMCENDDHDRRSPPSLRAT